MAARSLTGWLGIPGLRGPAQQQPGSFGRRMYEMMTGVSADIPAALGYSRTTGAPYFPLSGERGLPAPRGERYTPMSFAQLPGDYLSFLGEAVSSGALPAFRFPGAPGELAWRGAPGGQYEYQEPGTGAWRNPIQWAQFNPLVAPSGTAGGPSAPVEGQLVRAQPGDRAGLMARYKRMWDFFHRPQTPGVSRKPPSRRPQTPGVSRKPPSRQNLNRKLARRQLNERERRRRRT